MSVHDGRYAPSPSGPLHLGNLRTALLAWLFARSAGGRLNLRIDDLDPDRCRAEHEESQLSDLHAIGLAFDGPPLRQSERRDVYEATLARLDTYPCYCTRAEIRAAAGAPHGTVAVYPGTCRDMATAQRTQRAATGRPPAFRLRVAPGTTAVFNDRLHGRVEGPVDDFVVRRNDGVAAYHLATVLDDADQRVGEVVRGDDLLDATPAQVHLHDLLDLPQPTYAHVPLVLGPDGARLAKRHHGATLASRPEPVAATVARLLGSLGLPARLDDAVAIFDPDALKR